MLWAIYARAAADERLDHVFRRIGPFPRGGWSVHIARLEGFWRAVTGGLSAYRGPPEAETRPTLARRMCVGLERHALAGTEQA